MKRTRAQWIALLLPQPPAKSSTGIDAGEATGMSGRDATATADGAAVSTSESLVAEPKLGPTTSAVIDYLAGLPDVAAERAAIEAQVTALRRRKRA